MKYLKLLVLALVMAFTFGSGAANAQRVVVRERVDGRGYYYHHHHYMHRYWRHHRWYYR